MKILTNLRNLLRNNKGSVVVMSAVCMLVLVLMAALTIDTSRSFAARNELQNAVDASALAGASGFIMGQNKARTRAIEFAGYNTCNNHPVTLTSGEITFPGAERIRISAARQVPTMFAPVVGLMNMNISATATAELATIVATRGLRPLCVPDEGWDTGTPVVIKEGSVGGNGGKGKKGGGDPDIPACWHYPVCFPAMNRGNPDRGCQPVPHKV